MKKGFPPLIPAEAGIQGHVSGTQALGPWVPASAGTSGSVRHAHSRRQFLKATALTSFALLPMPAIAQGGAGRVVVVGGGFAGASCARALKKLDPRVSVTLVEQSRTFTACPFSNEVIAGLRELREQQFDYAKFAGDGVTMAFDTATAVDAQARAVTLANGTQLPYDRLVLAPGIDLRWDGLPGYTEAAAERMPHAWKAGEQTTLLRRQLEAMEDGGLVVISAPANPFRCPPGPYERASLIAYYLKAKKPKSKVMILDAKDAFSKQGLFIAAWKELYPNHLEWVALSKGGKVTSVEPATNTVVTEFGSHKAAVANIVPPQKAGRIAEVAGVADRTGWCPIDPVTFESRLVPTIHVIGDACIAGAMPKSGFAANSEAKAAAAAIAKLLAGEKPEEPRLLNTCYSVAAPDYGFSVAGVYKPINGQLMDIPGSGGVSPANAPAAARAQEAVLANAWFKTITAEAFG
jgi:sulfide dehydrogenase [flavocytochrome c] flavoprotein chain